MRQVLFVFLCVKMCVCVCVCVCQPPLSVSDFVSDGVCPPLHIDLQRRVCVCLCPFKTHADQPQLQPSMMHLLPQPVATGGHLPCVFFFFKLICRFSSVTQLSLCLFLHIYFQSCVCDPARPLLAAPYSSYRCFLTIATVLRDGSPRCVSWEIYMPEHIFRPRLINLRVELFSF